MKRRFLAALGCALALSACVSDPSGGPEPKRPDWDIRFVLNLGQQGSEAGMNLGDTVELFLNARGLIESECRIWKGGVCQMGNHFRYDARGNWEYTEEIMDGDTVGLETPLEYDYDSLGRIAFSRETMPGKKQPYRISEWLYDGSGHPIAINRYYDFIGGSPSGYWRMRYDAQGRMDSLYFNDGLFTVQSMRYAYDAAGRLERVTQAFGYYARYERDASGRIARIYHGGYRQDGSEEMYALSYRDDSVRYEPDPLRLFFTPQWYQ